MYKSKAQLLIFFLFFLQISQNTEPMLGLFVLIWMPLFILNQNMAMKILISNFFKKFENFNLLSVLHIYIMVESIKML